MLQDNEMPPTSTTPAPPPVVSYQGGAAPSKDDQNMALLCYVLAIFTGFVGPLIIWLLKKDSSPFIADQGKEVLNWEITLVIAWVVGVMTIWIFGLGALILAAAFICNLVFNIMGAIRTSKGQAYRYPFVIRLLA